MASGAREMSMAEMEMLRRRAAELEGMIRGHERTEKELFQRIDDQAALLAASRAFLEIQDISTTLETVNRMAVERFGLRMAWIGLVLEGSFEVYPVSVEGFEDGYLDHIRITWDDSPTGCGPTGVAIRIGHAVPMNRIDSDPAYEPWRQAAQCRGYRSSAALPLLSGDQVLGVLNVYSAEPEHFTDDRLKVLQWFANLAAVALEQARLFEEVQRQNVQFVRLSH